jgi:spermidine synthase
MKRMKERALFSILAGIFAASGFCGLLYQVIWLRLAFAAFGIITPVLSVVISVFMTGLAIGSWAGGRYAERRPAPKRFSAIVPYALVEALIGAGGLLVPVLFRAGQNLLLPAGSSDSFSYMAKSGIVLAVSILPWSIGMGATFPLMMKFIKQIRRERTSGFSFLYTANVVGALCGTVITAAVLIERLGLHRTLAAAAAVNFLIAALSLILNSIYLSSISRPADSAAEPEPPAADGLVGRDAAFAILFMTGFTSMGMEVVWTRAFTPVLLTTIYSFAGVLAVYLLATWYGARLYRKHLRLGRVRGLPQILAMLAVFSFLPIIAADPRLTVLNTALLIELVIAGIFPFCAALGYLTSKLIDDVSQGRPGIAGKAYAVNAAGCILGPLAAGYWLLPVAGVRISLILLAAPFLAAFVLTARALKSRRPVLAVSLGVPAGLLLTASLTVFLSYEDARFFRGGIIRRDATASVISYGQGMRKRLLVNGISMTELTPITKCMVHIPLAIRERKPQSALIICVGMGTSFRSAASWGIRTTGVELIPSVEAALGYYFDDAREILRSPKNRIVIDDGRRYLRRTTERYDLIAIDPPPPVEASGSSLLYSREFYQTAKLRLTPEGILQQWLPDWDEETLAAVAESLGAEFPHVRAFRSLEKWGIHFFASFSPLAMPTPDEFGARLPERAARDFVEWNPEKTPARLYAEVLGRELPLETILKLGAVPPLTDDRPINEYFLLRRLGRAVDVFTERNIR